MRARWQSLVEETPTTRRRRRIWLCGISRLSRSVPIRRQRIPSAAAPPPSLPIRPLRNRRRPCTHRVNAGITMASAGNPSIVAINPNAILLRRLMQAYVGLRDDPTWTARPLNFSTLRFLSISTATGDVYSDLARDAPAAFAVLVNQFESVQPAW